MSALAADVGVISRARRSRVEKMRKRGEKFVDVGRKCARCRRRPGRGRVVCGFGIIIPSLLLQSPSPPELRDFEVVILGLHKSPKTLAAPITTNELYRSSLQHRQSIAAGPAVFPLHKTRPAFASSESFLQQFPIEEFGDFVGPSFYKFRYGPNGALCSETALFS